MSENLQAYRDRGSGFSSEIFCVRLSTEEEQKMKRTSFRLPCGGGGVIYAPVKGGAMVALPE